MTIRLPVLPAAGPAPQPPFPIGSWVRLRSCPTAPPGEVEGVRYGRVLVHFPDLRLHGRYRPSALIAASQPVHGGET
jgi:hypothetical protein